MQANESLVIHIATTYYNIQPIWASIKQLHGYDDKNFMLTDAVDNKTYVLKIVTRDESSKDLTDIIDEILYNAREYCEAQQGSNETHFVVPKLIRTTGTKLSTLTTIKYLVPGQATGDAETFEEVKCNIKLSEFFDGLTVFDFLNKELASWRLASQLKQLELFYNRLGRVCNQLFVFLKTQQHLCATLDHIRAGSARNSWYLKGAARIISDHLNRLYPDKGHPRRALVLRVLSEHETRASVELMKLPEFVIHSDFNTRNVLIDARSKAAADKRQLCVIDFQDVQTGPQVAELAFLMLYCIIEQDQMPLETALSLLPRFILAGYQSNTSWPIGRQEIQLIPSLMKLRLCQSLLNGQSAHERDPTNSYVLQTNQRGWQLLEVMCNELSNETLVSSWRLVE